MTDGQVTVLIAAITWIFAAGGFYMWCRSSIKNLYRDLNGVGNRVRSNEEAATRRYHNVCAAVIIAADPKKEAELAVLLREGA